MLVSPLDDLTVEVGETSGGQSTNHFYERSKKIILVPECRWWMIWNGSLKKFEKLWILNHLNKILFSEKIWIWTSINLNNNISYSCSDWLSVRANQKSNAFNLKTSLGWSCLSIGRIPKLKLENFVKLFFDISEFFLNFST